MLRNVLSNLGHAIPQFRHRAYIGLRKPEPTVTVDGSPLDPRVELRLLSWEIDWGSPGSGSSQLALALLADFLANDELALSFYRAFTFSKIVKLPYMGWTLTSADLEREMLFLVAEMYA